MLGPPGYRRRRRCYRRLQPPRNRNGGAGGRQTRAGGETAGHHDTGLPTHYHAAEQSGHCAGDGGKLPPRSGQPDGACGDRRRAAGRPSSDDPDIARRQRCDVGHALAASEGKGGRSAWTWGVPTTPISSATIWGIRAHLWRGLIVEPVRRRPVAENHPLISYREQTRTYPETIEATGEDSILAQYAMQSGATVQFSHLGGGRGSGRFERSVHGRWGALDVPRTGRGGRCGCDWRSGRWRARRS